MAEKFESISAVGAADNVNVHGVVATLSPMKQEKRAKYFESKLTDGENQLHTVGFQDEQCSRLVQYQEKSEADGVTNWTSWKL